MIIVTFYNYATYLSRLSIEISVQTVVPWFMLDALASYTILTEIKILYIGVAASVQNKATFYTPYLQIKGQEVHGWPKNQPQSFGTSPSRLWRIYRQSRFGKRDQSDTSNSGGRKCNRDSQCDEGDEKPAEKTISPSSCVRKIVNCDVTRATVCGLNRISCDYCEGSLAQCSAQDTLNDPSNVV